MKGERVKRDCQCPKANHQHGTNQAYVTDKCRCEPCTAAGVRQSKIRRLRLQTRGPEFVSPIATRRHIDALRLAGWTMPELTAMLGRKNWRALQRTVYERERISRANADRIRRLHDKLELQRPPEGWKNKAARAATYAARRGAAPAAAFDDINDPASQPEVWQPRRLRPSSETAEEYRHLRSAGLSDEMIAKRLGLSLDGLDQALRRAA